MAADPLTLARLETTRISGLTALLSTAEKLCRYMMLLFEEKGIRIYAMGPDHAYLMRAWLSPDIGGTHGAAVALAEAEAEEAAAAAEEEEATAEWADDGCRESGPSRKRRRLPVYGNGAETEAATEAAASQYERFTAVPFHVVVSTDDVYRTATASNRDDAIALRVVTDVAGNVDPVGLELRSWGVDGDTVSMMPILEIDAEATGRAINVEMQPAHIVSLPTVHLKDANRDLPRAAIGKDLTISVRPGDKPLLVLSCQGDSGFIQRRLGVPSVQSNGAETGGHARNGPGLEKSTFSSNILSKMLNMANTCPTVTLSLQPDFPLHLRFQIPQLGEVSFMLAPKID